MNAPASRESLAPVDRRTFMRRSASALAAVALPAATAPMASGKTPNLKTIWAIAELWQWLYQRQKSSGTDSADCLQAHLDFGVRNVIWSLGRSTLDYQSSLPNSTMYVGDTRPETKPIADSFKGECSLRAALAFAAKNKMTIYGRLGMNRHYGDAFGGGLRSRFIACHPDWLERHRSGKIDATKVSFAIPEYREERISILLEAVRIGAHGLCLDFCRQPPAVRYHPETLHPWLEAGRPDPRQMRADSPQFLGWSKHRCEFVTIFMRDLRAGLRLLEKDLKRTVPIMARIPEATLQINLMEGFDLRTWLEEALVDEVTLDPIWIWDFEYPDSANEYVTLARRHAVKIYGGANATAGRGVKPNARAFLERVSRNHGEAVDGIALFQTDAALLVPELKALFSGLIPQLEDPNAVSDSLAAARTRQPELSESERAFGLDNHSILTHLTGSPRLSFDTL
jgi:hypothetical protein